MTSLTSNSRRYMSSADYALREVLAAKLVQPPTTTTRIYARQEPSLRNFRPREGNTRTDRLNFPVLDSHAQPDVRAGRRPISNPEAKEREAVGRVSSIFSDAGGFSWSGFRVPTAGRYRIRVQGYSIWVSGGGVDHWNFTGFGPEKVSYLYQPTYHRPNPDEVWPGRRNEPIGVYAQSSGQSRPLSAFDFTPEPSIHEVEVLLSANEVIQTDAMRLFRTRVNGSEEEYVNPLAEKDGMPGVAFQWLEVEGPLYDQTAGEGYRLMFGELPLRRMEKGQTGGVTVQIVAPAPPPGDGAGGRGRFAPRMQDVDVDVTSDHPREDAERLIRAFLARAYRRPVEEAHAKRFLELFNQQFELGHGFTKSLISTYTAILCSPGYLYVQEAPGKLDDYALATRLALFLWNSPPDAELRTLAAQGRLSKPEILRAQTDRLLNDAKSRRFIDAFTDYWLDLRKIDDSSPSTTLYNDYELDDPLKLAAVDETRLFVQEMFSRNLPARTVVDSDFTFLNERLAKHYGIAGVEGVAMRKVTLPKDSLRGGIMTQASVLKGHGQRHDHFACASWRMDYGTHPRLSHSTPARRARSGAGHPRRGHHPPATRSSSRRPYMRFLSSEDRPSGICAGKLRCHGRVARPLPRICGKRKAGARYRPFGPTIRLPLRACGRFCRRPHRWPHIQRHSRIQALLLTHDERTVGRNLVSQLITYGTGAPVGFSDRKQVEEILDKTRGSAIWGPRHRSWDRAERSVPK